MNWQISRISKPTLELTIEPGDRVFLVGPNGSGKSALIQHFVSSNKNNNVRRIAAHRPTAFTSERPHFSFHDRTQSEQQIEAREHDYNARWRDDQHIGHEMQSIVLSDLREQERHQAFLVRDKIRQNDVEGARKESKIAVSPLGRINHLFQVANLPVSLELSQTGDFLAHHSEHDTTYSIAHMSDGERNATIIAATVLTVKSGTVLLIDEPERHLHRSIVQPFLSTLFSQRTDCTFIISTHDISLPAVDPTARVITVRSCRWKGSTVEAWNVELLPGDSALPEDIRRSILGSRNHILFVEGTEDSLDSALYGALFPNISVAPTRSCTEVIKAVRGLRLCSELHDVQAFGLIDRDDRTQTDIQDLAKEGIFALGVSSAESLYCYTDAITAVARRQADSLGCDADTMALKVHRVALDTLRKTNVVGQMAARRCERTVRSHIISRIPDWKSISAGENEVSFTVCLSSSYQDELRRFRSLLDCDDYNAIIARYPIKHSTLLSDISIALKCRNTRDYRHMVLARIKEDDALAQCIRARIQPLAEHIYNSLS